MERIAERLKGPPTWLEHIAGPQFITVSTLRSFQQLVQRSNLPTGGAASLWNVPVIPFELFRQPSPQSRYRVDVPHVVFLRDEQISACEWSSHCRVVKSGHEAVRTRIVE